jgi:probable HAF family extracellular repeat protein
MAMASSTALRAFLVRPSIAALILLIPHSSYGQPVFKVEDLGILPGGTYNFPRRINDLGHVVGEADTSSSNYARPFLWVNGSLQELGVLPGGVGGWATGINNLGRIVGTTSFIGSMSMPYIQEGGSMVSVLPPGAESGGAMGLNAAGNFAINASSSSGSTVYLWNNGSFEQMPLLSDYIYGNAIDINDFNQMVGVCSTLSSQRAVIWSGGIVIPIGDAFGAVSSAGMGLNNLGEVVGHFQQGDYITPFLWKDMVGQALPRVPGDVSSGATDVNDSGWIVGFGSYGTGGFAILWDENLQPYDLNTLIDPLFAAGWELQMATALNNKGQIVGYGMLNGNYRGFIATPMDLSFPHSFTVESGGHLSGGVGNLSTSNNQYVTILTSHFAVPIILSFDSTAEYENVDTITFSYEAHNTNPSTIQLLEMYDFVSSSWEMVHVRLGSTNDVTAVVSVPNASRFVEAGSKAMRARATISSSARNARSWQHRVDYVRWATSR